MPCKVQMEELTDAVELQNNTEQHILPLLDTGQGYKSTLWSGQKLLPLCCSNPVLDWWVFAETGYPAYALPIIAQATIEAVFPETVNASPAPQQKKKPQVLLLLLFFKNTLLLLKLYASLASPRTAPGQSCGRIACLCSRLIGERNRSGL